MRPAYQQAYKTQIYLSKLCQAPQSMGTLQARILKWVAISSSKGPFQPRNWTHVSCVAYIVGGFFTHCGAPLLRALSRGSRLYGAWSLRNRERLVSSCWTFVGTLWPDLHGRLQKIKDSDPKKFATNNHILSLFSIKARILTQERWFFGTPVHHLVSLLAFQIKLLFFAPTTHLDLLAYHVMNSSGRCSEVGLGKKSFIREVLYNLS